LTKLSDDSSGWSELHLITNNAVTIGMITALIWATKGAASAASEATNVQSQQKKYVHKENVGYDF